MSGVCHDILGKLQQIPKTELLLTIAIFTYLEESGFPTCHSPHERVPGQYHPLPLPAMYAAQPQGNQTWLAGKSPRNVDEL